MNDGSVDFDSPILSVYIDAVRPSAWFLRKIIYRSRTLQVHTGLFVKHKIFWHNLVQERIGKPYIKTTNA